jgi:hypothetical protein
MSLPDRNRRIFIVPGTLKPAGGETGGFWREGKLLFKRIRNTSSPFHLLIIGIFAPPLPGDWKREVIFCL